MKKKTIIYLPGIISIIGLPVLLFFWGPQDPVKQNCVALTLRSDESNTDSKTQKSGDDLLQHKKIVRLDLDDFVWNEQSQYVFNQKMAFISREIERIKFANDTDAVVKVSFGNQNNLNSVVFVLNKAILYGVDKYEFSGNDLYLFLNKEVKPLYSTIQFTPATIAKWKNTKMGFQYKLSSIKQEFAFLFYRQRQNVIVTLGFLVLIVLPGIMTIRRYFIKLTNFAYTFS